MHGREAEDGAAALLEAQRLELRLERDESGELRDQLFGELHVAAQEIETLLAGKPAAGQREVLEPLLGAVTLSQDLLLDVWDSLHGNSVHR